MKNKNYNIEVVRTLSFIFVILIHVSNYFCRGIAEISKGEYFFALVLNTVARVSVPCFFMMSGALLLPESPDLKKSGIRLLRILGVLAFWSVVYYLFNRYYMGTPYNLRDFFFEPTEAHLWYLYAIIPIYLVLPFFQIMCRGMDGRMNRAFLLMGVLAVFCMYFASLIQEEAYYDVPIIGDKAYAFYFFLGYFIRKYKKKGPFTKGALALIFAGSTVGSVVITLWMDSRIGDHYERFLEYGSPLIVIASGAFFMFFLKLGDGNIQLKERTRNTIDTWCSCSFGIYLIHILFLDVYKKQFDAGDISGWLGIPILTAGIVCLAFACTYVLRNIPFGKYVT